MDSQQLIAFARGWLGVPYLHQGRSRYGVDCIGFPIAVLRELDLLPREFNDYRNYGRQPDGQMQPIIERYCENLPTPVAGCLILIQWPQRKHASHAAFFTGKTMLHSHQRAGGVVENGYRGAWVKNTHSLWRLPGVLYV